MSSNDSSEPKKYPPSKKKLEKLKKDGQFPKTELFEPTLDSLTGCLLLIGFIILLFDGGSAVIRWVTTPTEVNYVSSVIMTTMLLVLALIFIIKLIQTLLTWAMVSRFLLNMSGLKPKLESINPIEGVKNNYGLSGITKSLRSVVELLFLCFMLVYVFQIKSVEINEIKFANNPISIIELLILSIFVSGSFFIIFGFVTGAIDYFLEVYSFKEKNKMTYTEMKEELKETEGNPEVKSKRKQNAREQFESPNTNNRTPNFALANPTHLLVPICYDSEIDRVPIVLDIYKDTRAQDMKQKYKNDGIPVIEHVKLARAIYSDNRGGNCFLNKERFRDIAIILKIVSRIK